MGDGGGSGGMGRNGSFYFLILFISVQDPQHHTSRSNILPPGDLRTSRQSGFLFVCSRHVYSKRRFILACTPVILTCSPGVLTKTHGVLTCTPVLPTCTPGVLVCIFGVLTCTPGVPNYTPGVLNCTPGVPTYTDGVLNCTLGVLT